VSRVINGLACAAVLFGVMLTLLLVVAFWMWIGTLIGMDPELPGLAGLVLTLGFALGAYTS
jgi:hypothetical protein